MKNEEVIGTKEKMIKSCSFASKVILVLECIIGIGAVLLVIFGIALGIAIKNSPVEDNDYVTESVYEEKQEEVISGSGDIVILENAYIDEENLGIPFDEIIRFVLSVVILDMIRRILKNTAKDETPFSVGNLKKIKAIDICMTICWICSTSIISMELIYIILITSIYMIFKYGYELQLESDETL